MPNWLSVVFPLNYAVDVRVILICTILATEGLNSTLYSKKKFLHIKYAKSCVLFFFTNLFILSIADKKILILSLSTYTVRKVIQISAI